LTHVDQQKAYEDYERGTYKSLISSIESQKDPALQVSFIIFPQSRLVLSCFLNVYQFGMFRRVTGELFLIVRCFRSNMIVLFEFTRADAKWFDTGGVEVIFGQNLPTRKVELTARLGKAAATLFQTGFQDCYHSACCEHCVVDLFFINIHFYV